MALLSVAAGAALSLYCAGSASAQTLTWNNGAGGSAAVAGNWNPAQIPAGANDLLFNLNNIYTVTWNATVGASRTHVYRQGSITGSFTNPHTASTGITIGDTNALAATFTHSSGTLTSNGLVQLGTIAGSIGNLNVTDDSADFIITGTADMTVGVNGDAALSITGGGLVQVGDQFIAGSNATSSPMLTVSGAQAVSPFQRSTLSVLGTSQSRLGQGGDATVNISNGALASFAGDLVVSNGSASISTLTIGGGGGIGNIHDATLSVAGDLLLGTNTTVASPGGTATVTLNSNGLLSVGGTLQLGTDPDGGTAALTINNNSVVDAGSFVDGAFGTLDHNAGTLRINGGTYTGHADPLVVTGTGGPTLHLTGSLTKTLSPAGAVGLVVGNDLGAGTFSGTLLIDGGADLILSGASKDINIGDDTGTTGTITVTGAGSRLVANQPGDDIRVGFIGTGNLIVDNSGQVLANNIEVPASSLNGSGLLAMNTGGASVVTTVNLAVGNSVGGAGTVTINQNATLNATNAGIGVLIRTTGQIGVGAGGTLNATGTVLVNGGELQVHGTVTAGTLVDIDTAGSLIAGLDAIGTPLVDAPVHVRTGGVIEVIGDDLTMGDATSAAGFVGDDGSLITIGATTLTLLDSNEAIVDTVTLAGGTLAAPNGIDILNNGSIDGTGTITTPELFFNSGGGVITATGAAGITINGKLRNNSGTIDGTKYTFNNGGPQSGWTGAGAINARAVFNSGTELNALANMTIGLNVFDGVTFNLGSELHADTRTVTLLDSNGLGLGSVTDFSGGHVVCAQPLVVSFGRRLSGRGGSVDTPSLTVNGHLSPGELVGAPAGETGEMTINGSLTLQANADFDAEIGGFLRPIEFDRVVVHGPAVLNGAVNVSLINGFNPPPGTRFVIMEYTSFTGNFLTRTLPPGWQIIIRPRFIEAVNGCPADFNHDGVVNSQDFFDFIVAFFNADPEQNGGPADFNLDGVVNSQDFFDFIVAFFGGC